jgi:hypothetical protein
MRINSLSIQGFRGFNSVQQIDFHERITLIYAPNSYGKTSISEALEWLLYGTTSKIKGAAYKDEFKGSCRNAHLESSLIPIVRACFQDGGEEVVFTGEMQQDDSIKRFLRKGTSATEVDVWPLNQESGEGPRPFILQHELKYLLLARPDERFQRFAHLLGLDELDEIHRNIISLCTATDHCVPPAVKKLQGVVASIRERAQARPSLSETHRKLKMKETTVSSLYDAVNKDCKCRVPAWADDGSQLQKLVDARQEAVGKVFSGNVLLPLYDEVEKQANMKDQVFLADSVTKVLAEGYSKLRTVQCEGETLSRAQMYRIGLRLLERNRASCPLCNQPLSGPAIEQMQKEGDALSEQAKRIETFESDRAALLTAIDNFRTRLTEYHKRNDIKARKVLSVQSALPQVRSFLGTDCEAACNRLSTTLVELSAVIQSYDRAFQVAFDNLKKIHQAVKDIQFRDEPIVELEEATKDCVSYVGSLTELLVRNDGIDVEIDQVLQNRLDVLAGTEDITVLVDILAHRTEFEQEYEIQHILESVRGLKKTVDDHVNNKVLTAISEDMSSNVMYWYRLIKTTGDPEVHFDGFDLERTRKGDLKSRRVCIKAKSYDHNLVSAVSSLSESKLNALGLCISIAANLSSPSPFDFLVIDDPIQSLDSQHETQFIEVIRTLAMDHDKQIILLSHNSGWLKQVRLGCRSLNGIFYEMTGYSKDGPLISVVPWEKWTERLKEVNSIINDLHANSVRLQQAEEEIRIVVCELAAGLYQKRKGMTKSPHKMNRSDVRRILTECSVESRLVDRIDSTFGTTDDSHHAPKNYTPDRERIRQYYAWANELANLVN